MTIVTAVDGEQVPSQMVRVGDRLARQFDDDLVVLHVMSNDRFEERRRATSQSGVDSSYLDAFTLPGHGRDSSTAASRSSASNGYSTSHGESDAARVARHVVDETLDDTSTVSIQGRVGEPVGEILAEADRREARYLVIGGRKRTPIGKSVFGSTTQSLLLNTNRPVVTVPDDEHRTTPTGPVVAAVDRSERASRVVDEGATLAGAVDRDLHVIHVRSPSDARNGSRFTSEEGEHTISGEDGRDAATRIAREAADPITDRFSAIGLVGSPSEQILEYATDHDANYVVVAGRNRSPVGKVLFGSTTQSVVLNADCPVLSLMSGQ